MERPKLWSYPLKNPVVSHKVIQVGKDEINSAESVRNLAVIFDSKLSMKDQVNKSCQLAFIELRIIE